MRRGNLIKPIITTTVEANGGVVMKAKSAVLALPKYLRHDVRMG